MADTGVGIAPEELHKLFSAFVQTESGRKAQQGTGLGLAISRSFVELMGGAIRVNSQVGGGSAFRFDITVNAADAAKPAMQPRTSRLSHPGCRRSCRKPPTGGVPARTAWLCSVRSGQWRGGGQHLAKVAAAPDLHGHAYAADANAIAEAVGDMRPHDAALSDALELLAADYDYTRMLLLLAGGQAHVRKAEPADANMPANR